MALSSQDEKLIQKGQALPLMEEFYTIQGEGFHQGKAAYFIRLGGCSVGCHWCDVKESWDATQHPLIDVREMADNAAQFPGRLAVVTGGEPCEYNLEGLTSELKSKGFATNIETSGSFPLSGQWDWVCVSPKKFKKPLPEVLPLANELKVVIYNKSDFEWAESFVSSVSKDCLLYLQPEWSKQEDMLPSIIDYIKYHPQWRISLQTHKYMDIP